VDSSGSGEGPVEGSCEHGNETSDSIKDREFIAYTRDYYLLKKDSHPWSLFI